MSFRAPKLELVGYIPAPVRASMVHGVAICTLDGERLEPILAMRTEDGELRLSADAVGYTPGKPDVVLHDIFGGRKLSTLTKTQESMLDAIVRAHVEPLIALEDELLGPSQFLQIDPCLELVRYLPFPTPPGMRSNTLGAAQVTIDGRVLEPLVVQKENGTLLVSAPESMEVPPGIDFDFSTWPSDLTIDHPLCTRELRRQITALVQHAAIRGEAVP